MHHHILYIDSELARLIPVDPLSEGYPIAAAAHEIRPRVTSDGVAYEAFLRDVCVALGTTGGVLVVGPTRATAQLLGYLAAHAPDTARRIVGVNVAEQPTDPEIARYVSRVFRVKPAR